jgi:hypothetical protein
MKVKVYGDEWYPVYTIDDNFCATEIEVDEKTLRRWARAEKQFSKMQEEIASLVETK